MSFSHWPKWLLLDCKEPQMAPGVCFINYGRIIRRECLPIWSQNGSFSFVCVDTFLWHSQVTKPPQVGHGLPFCPKVILAFNYSITSTFASTQTDRPALKVKIITLTFRSGLSVCVLANVDFISQLKAIWLSAKILIKIRTLSTDSAISIWILN